MVRREFLGWDAPFLGKAVEWLLSCRAEWPRTLVVVPTAQGGRRLREALAERCGACLAPRVTTPGQWLRPAGEKVASRAVETAAWVEVFESVADWAEFAEVFPVAPDGSGDRAWVNGLARSLVELRRALQENALTLAGAAQRMAGTVEAERWRDLARLEERVEHRLGEWGLRSRSAALAAGLAEFPEGVRQVVLAGVSDVAPAVARHWRGCGVPLIALIGAPACEAGALDDLGLPLGEAWLERVLPWPEGDQVEVTADPRQQAEAALRRVAEAGTASDGLALGSADAETAGELVRCFGRAGWLLHDPSHVRPGASVKWLALWRKWLAVPDAAAALDLLGHPLTAVITGGRRAQAARGVSVARDRWLVSGRDGMERAMQSAREEERAAMAEGLEALRALEGARDRWLGGGGIAGLENFVELLAAGDPAGAEFLAGWTEEVGLVAGEVSRDPGFWLDILLEEWPQAAPPAPEGRLLDVQGWLELLHEPGRHLVLCGMNEGKVPAVVGGDAWLSESTRGILGLPREATRAARDCFLFASMVEARRVGGRVDVLLAKSSAGGDALLPSRLLLAARRDELPGRVEVVFREVAPPDAGLVWNADWQWRPRELPPPERISVTALVDYLACPFRYYLKHVVRMARPEPERREWNARDFGSVAHSVLEAWAGDPEAVDMSKGEAIEERVLAILDEMLEGRFGGKPPLAVRIQVEGLRQRLRWFARQQACERATGWRIEEVEKKFEVPVAGVTVVGKIDRIDVHADGRRRVLDYKTKAKAEDVEKAHRSRIVASTTWPRHLAGVEAVCCTGRDRGKEVAMRWRNLQVPLYAAVLGDVAELGYFALGATEGEVKLSLWQDFRDTDRDSALRCAEWIVGRIQDRVFWPPAERVDHDDVDVLAAGKTLAAVVAEPMQGGAR